MRVNRKLAELLIDRVRELVAHGTSTTGIGNVLEWEFGIAPLTRCTDIAHTKRYTPCKKCQPRWGYIGEAIEIKEE